MNKSPTLHQLQIQYNQTHIVDAAVFAQQVEQQLKLLAQTLAHLTEGARVSTRFNEFVTVLNAVNGMTPKFIQNMSVVIPVNLMTITEALTEAAQLNALRVSGRLPAKTPEAPQIAAQSVSAPVTEPSAANVVHHDFGGSYSSASACSSSDSGSFSCSD